MGGEPTLDVTATEEDPAQDAVGGKRALRDEPVDAVDGNAKEARKLPGRHECRITREYGVLSHRVRL